MSYPAVRHRLLVSMIFGLFCLCGLQASAQARTWQISFQLEVADFGTVALDDQVVIPDSGGTGFGGAIPGFSATHNDQTQTFSVRIDVELPDFELSADLQCDVDVLITGSAPVQDLSAFGFIKNSTFTHCTIGGSSFTQSLAITGSFIAQTMGSVSSTAVVTGEVEIITPQGTTFTSSNFTAVPGMEIRTGPNDRVQITFPDGSKIDMGPNASFIFETDDQSKGFSGFLRKGKAVFDVLFNPGRRYRVRTPIACACVRGTNFSVEYQESNLTGALTVVVNEGVVDIEERNSVITQVSAGQQRSITREVNRVTTVLPADSSDFLLGRSNFFSWTAYPGAAGYLLEAIVSPPGFFQANATAVQAGSVIITPMGLFESDGVVDWSLFVGAGGVPAGTVVQWRIFPLDVTGQLIPGATSSDAVTFTVQ